MPNRATRTTVKGVSHRLRVFGLALATLIPGLMLSALANRLSFLLWGLVATAAVQMALTVSDRWQGDRTARGPLVLGMTVFAVSAAMAIVLEIDAAPLELGLRAEIPLLFDQDLTEQHQPGDSLPLVFRPMSWSVLGLSAAALGAWISRRGGGTQAHDEGASE